MNKIELEVVLLRKGKSIAELSEKIGMNRATFYRKLQTGKFERSEIIQIRDELGLSDEEMLLIFFSGESCVNATNAETASVQEV